MNNTIYSSTLKKLCFNNGYYDFEKSVFINNFKDIETNIQIDMDFPHRDNDVISNIYEKNLNPIFGSDLLPPFLHFISRVIAGESCIRTYIHTYVDRYIHTYAYMHTYIHTHIHTYIHTYMHAYIRIHAYIHKCIQTFIAYIHTYMHVYIHACMHTHIHRCGTQRHTITGSRAATTHCTVVS